MANLKPATNITASGIAMALTAMVLRTLQANMIIIPDEVMNDLPGIVAVIVGYAWDLYTGENQKVIPAAPVEAAKVQ